MFNRTERTQILSLSTRGIGFGTMYVTTMARQYQQDIIVPSIYSMYRAFLALLEAKLQICPILSRYPNFTLQYNLDAHMLHLACTTSFVPHPISRIINAVGILKYKERSYAPAVASSPISRAGVGKVVPVWKKGSFERHF
ncbi:hypothetical protein M8J77_009134 [Diaphorina citri]|nr:hypothetical protein M8J77_009134 [Diaphorina citri]